MVSSLRLAIFEPNNKYAPMISAICRHRRRHDVDKFCCRVGVLSLNAALSISDLCVSFSHDLCNFIGLSPDRHDYVATMDARSIIYIRSGIQKVILVRFIYDFENAIKL